jgi:hypothetical protein
VRTRYVPWQQFFEELKKFPPEEPFTLGLSDDSDARVKGSRATAPKKEIRPVSPVFRIRKDPRISQGPTR